MFAAVVREGELVRLPSRRIAQVLEPTAGEPGFFECQYLDDGKPVTIHCKHMIHVSAPKNLVGGYAVGLVPSSLGGEVVNMHNEDGRV